MNLDQLIDTLRSLPEPAIERVKGYVEYLRTEQVTSDEVLEEQFWSLIELVQVGWEEEMEDFAPLTDRLAEQGEKAIYAFEEQLARKLSALDGPAYFKHAGKNGSADSFLYARCSVVLTGRKTYEDILVHPDNFPKTLWWNEELLYCAATAFKQRFGKEMVFMASVIYESFYNEEQWGKGTVLKRLGISAKDVEEKAKAWQ